MKKLIFISALIVSGMVFADDYMISNHEYQTSYLDLKSVMSMTKSSDYHVRLNENTVVKSSHAVGIKNTDEKRHSYKITRSLKLLIPFQKAEKIESIVISLSPNELYQHQFDESFNYRSDATNTNVNTYISILSSTKITDAVTNDILHYSDSTNYIYVTY